MAVGTVWAVVGATGCGDVGNAENELLSCTGDCQLAAVQPGQNVYLCADPAEWQYATSGPRTMLV